MPEFLLDTNVVSELRRAKKCDPSVAAWQKSQLVESCYLSVISLMEIRLGIELAKRRDAVGAKALARWYEGQVAEECAALHATRTRPFRDALILATAKVHRLTVVTRNEVDFVDAGTPVLNPWNSLNAVR
jgi:predicted nucleic acid-binding protein